MDDLQADDIKTSDENSAMVLLVDDQAMIGEAVRRGLPATSRSTSIFAPTRTRRLPRRCRSSRR